MARASQRTLELLKEYHRIKDDFERAEGVAKHYAEQLSKVSFQLANACKDENISLKVLTKNGRDKSSQNHKAIQSSTIF